MWMIWGSLVNFGLLLIGLEYNFYFNFFLVFKSLKESHILAISDLGSLPADHPIFNVITMPEVITLGIVYNFLYTSRS